MASIALMYCAFIFLSLQQGAGAIPADRPAPAPPSGASLHLLDALYERGVQRSVFVPNRFNRLHERLPVLDLDDLGAGFLHVLDGFLLHYVPELVCPMLRLI